MSKEVEKTIDKLLSERDTGDHHIDWQEVFEVFTDSFSEGPENNVAKLFGMLGVSPPNTMEPRSEEDEDVIEEFWTELERRIVGDQRSIRR